MIRCYVFDIDGTVANCDHRLHHIQKDPKDWKGFYADTHKDEPILNLVRLIKDLIRVPGVEIVYATGRGEESRKATVDWLDRNVYVGPLFMRPANDYRQDSIVKIEMLQAIREAGYEPVLWFEDRKQCVDALRAAGVNVMQVAEGNF